MGFLSKARKKLGKFFLYWAGNKPFLIVADPNAARQVLSDGKSFIKGYEYSKVFSLAFGEGLVTSGSEKHRKDRFLRVSLLTKLPYVVVLWYATENTSASTSCGLTSKTT